MSAKKKSGDSSKRSPKYKRYPPAFKLRVVKLYTEEGYTSEMIARELGICKSTVFTWTKRYREEGEAGLQDRPPVHRKREQVGPSVKARAVELKRKDPQRGVRRISQLLKRNHLMKASPETVRQTLKEAGLSDPPVKKKPKRNPQKPRFFERSRPNQLWQTDIFCFRLGGRNAYLIGYIDDYSRYITGLGLYRSQTAEHVIETYRCGVAEYGVPKEMLTDNGRQYTNWRGTTRFEAELKKDRIKHIRSQPHHPMTLGKIERFWKSIYTEFLSRVQFTSFEEARQRLALWVKYYNYKRPHQGIGGLCPADRFFEIQTQLRKVLEQGIEENVLEAALRGPPREPFYMVGRMGDQSVVIRAEKGKVKMLVDGEEPGKDKELEYDVSEQHRTEKGRIEENEAELHGKGEVRGGPVGMVGTPEALGGVPGSGDHVAAVRELAEGGDQRDAQGARTALASGKGPSGPAGAEGGETAFADGTAGAAPEPARCEAQSPGTVKEGRSAETDIRRALAERIALLPEREAAIVLELLEGNSSPATEGEEDECMEPECAGEGAGDLPGEVRSDERGRRGAAAGDEPEKLLQVGASGSGGDNGKPLRAESGEAARRPEPGAGAAEAPARGTGAGARRAEQSRRAS
jgi:transposase InsO family protein